MHKNNQLIYTIAYILGGMSIVPSSSAAQSTIYYNPAGAYASNIVSDQVTEFRDGGAYLTFAGWNPSVTPMPFGFNNEKLHWAAEINNAGDTLTVSSQDAHDRYGIWADLDTAKGAWFDGYKGWEHQTDVGLIKSNTDTVVTMNITGLGLPGGDPAWEEFGISVYSGMPEGLWTAHGTWNCATCTGPDFYADHPLSEGGTTYVTHGAVNSIDSISFHATAGVVYTILLGGNSGKTVYSPQEGYAVNISTAAAVPVPAGIWLFSGAMVSLMGAVGKKRKA